MKIAVVCAGTYVGGAERVATTLSNCWTDAGHAVELITFERAGAPPAFHLSDRVSLVQLGLVGASTSYRQAVAQNFARVAALRKCLRAFSADATLSLMTVPNILMLLASIGAPWPTVISERIHPGHHAVEQPWQMLRRLLYRRADALVVQTSDIADWFRSTMRLQANVIPNPIDFKRFGDTLHSPARRMNRRRAITVGRLGRQKGYDLLITAFARVANANPDWDLVIYGEGPDRFQLQDLIGSVGMDRRIVLAGYTGDVERAYADADLVVHPSRYEGYPNAVQEAMAAGRAVIATDCPGATRELLAGGRYGLLVPNEDVDALAHALSEIMPDHERRASLARSAKAAVEAFEASAIAERWAELFRELIDKRTRK